MGQPEIAQRLVQTPDSNFISFYDPVERGVWRDPGHRLRTISLELPFRDRVLRLPVRFDRRFLLRGARWSQGSQWSVLGRRFCEFATSDRETRRFKRFVRTTWIPDENFFQTLMISSRFQSSMVDDNKRMIDWRTGPEGPRIFRTGDFDRLVSSDAFFARKFDETVDVEILELLERRLEH